jgi:hypothetical protein
MLAACGAVGWFSQLAVRAALVYRADGAGSWPRFKAQQRGAPWRRPLRLAPRSGGWMVGPEVGETAARPPRQRTRRPMPDRV